MLADMPETAVFGPDEGFRTRSRLADYNALQNTHLRLFPFLDITRHSICGSRTSSCIVP